MLTVESLHEVVEFFGLKSGSDPVLTQSTGMLRPTLTRIALGRNIRY